MVKQLTPGQPVHFIGIGGVGMSGLAKLLFQMGYHVTGSDVKANGYVEALKALGITIFIGHNAQNLPKKGLVVQSTAVVKGNPEIDAALAQGLPIWHRSDVLQYILAQHPQVIGVTGTHGKTTITGMCGELFAYAQTQPTVIVGGKLPQYQTNALYGPPQQLAIAELDESDGTVVAYQPSFSIICNLELDHPDHYQGGVDSLLATFRQYLGHLVPGQTVLMNGDCPLSQSLIPAIPQGVRLLQLYIHSEPPAQSPPETTYQLKHIKPNSNGGYQGSLITAAHDPIVLSLCIPGEHMLWNAAFSAIAGLEHGLPSSVVTAGLAEFKGMGRRFERVGTYQGAIVIDDYAHHPTEIIATLKTAQEFVRQQAGSSGSSGRVIALVQPHRYGRVEALWAEYLTCFQNADVLRIVDIYSAGEAPIESVSSPKMCLALQATHPDVAYWPTGDWADITAQLTSPGFLKSGDVLLTIGAGDITALGRRLVTL